MSGIDELLAGNARTVENFNDGDLPIVARRGTVVVSCVDARVDPLQIFDAELGDIFILRSVGGRVTSEMMSQIAMVRTLISSVPGADPLDVVVVHHTKCGSVRFSDPELRDEAASAGGVDPAVVAASVVGDPFESVAEDVARVEAAVEEGTRVVGLVYDIETGVVTPL